MALVNQNGIVQFPTSESFTSVQQNAEASLRLAKATQSGMYDWEERQRNVVEHGHLVQLPTCCPPLTHCLLLCFQPVCSPVPSAGSPTPTGGAWWITWRSTLARRRAPSAGRRSPWPAPCAGTWSGFTRWTSRRSAGSPTTRGVPVWQWCGEETRRLRKEAAIVPALRGFNPSQTHYIRRQVWGAEPGRVWNGAYAVSACWW